MPACSKKESTGGPRPRQPSNISMKLSVKISVERERNGAIWRNADGWPSGCQKRSADLVRAMPGIWLSFWPDLVGPFATSRCCHPWSYARASWRLAAVPKAITGRPSRRLRDRWSHVRRRQAEVHVIVQGHSVDIQTQIQTNPDGDPTGIFRYRWRCSCGCNPGPWHTGTKHTHSHAEAARMAREGGADHLASQQGAASP